MEHDREQGAAGKHRKDDANEPVYYYEDAGIRERHGHVPLWLWGVAAVLVAWGIYYLVAYWSPPSG